MVRTKQTARRSTGGKAPPRRLDSSPPDIGKLLALDENVISAVRDGAIALVDANALRGGAMGSCVQRRQELEASGEQSLLLPPETAVSHLQSCERKVAALTYGWGSVDFPDPSGEVLATIVAFLRSDAGAAVEGLFWDFCSLYQPPRSEVQTKLFKTALGCMGDIYASPLATMVLRHEFVPECPPAIAADVALFGVGSDADPAAVRSFLEASGAIATLDFEAAKSCWRARFATTEAAVAAVDWLSTRRGTEPFAGAGGCLWYNEREYDARGWCCFELAVATEALDRLQFYPRLFEIVQARPPKLIDIGTHLSEEGDAVSLPPADLYGARPRVRRHREAIRRAAFTGSGDRAIVQAMYDEYNKRIGNAIAEVSNASGTFLKGLYEGTRAGDDEVRHGHGTEWYGDGTVYVGTWAHDKKHGAGRFFFPSGDSYIGAFEDDRMQGAGAYAYVDGLVDVSAWADGRAVGDGVRWSEDRQTASRLHDGEVVDAQIAPEEAAAIAQRLEIDVPTAAEVVRTHRRRRPSRPLARPAASANPPALAPRLPLAPLLPLEAHQRLERHQRLVRSRRPSARLQLRSWRRAMRLQTWRSRRTAPSQPARSIRSC